MLVSKLRKGLSWDQDDRVVVREEFIYFVFRELVSVEVKIRTFFNEEIVLIFSTYILKLANLGGGEKENN